MTVTRIQTTSGQYPVKGVGYDPNAGTVLDPETGNDLPADHISRCPPSSPYIPQSEPTPLTLHSGPKPTPLTLYLNLNPPP